MKIYVAGPLTAKSKLGEEQNALHAIKIGIEVFKKGHIPYIPHLTILVERAGLSLSKKDWVEKWDKPWLEVCDAILIIGWSDGVEQEVEIAGKNRLIMYRSIDEIPDMLSSSTGPAR